MDPESSLSEAGFHHPRGDKSASESHTLADGVPVVVVSHCMHTFEYRVNTKAIKQQGQYAALDMCN